MKQIELPQTATTDIAIKVENLKALLTYADLLYIHLLFNHQQLED